MSLNFLSYTAVSLKEKQSGRGSQQSIATVQHLETFTKEPLNLGIFICVSVFHYHGKTLKHTEGMWGK